MAAEYYARYSFYPPYCQMRPSSSYGLSFNYNGGNYGSCSSTRTCLCLKLASPPPPPPPTPLPPGVAMQVTEFHEISYGTCASRGSQLVTTKDDCEWAASALGQVDKIATSYYTSYQPRYCYRYYWGSNGLRFNTRASTTSCSYYYRCLCKKFASPPPAPSYPPLPDGNPLFSSSSSTKCVVSSRQICACSSNYDADQCDRGDSPTRSTVRPESNRSCHLWVHS